MAGYIFNLKRENNPSKAFQNLNNLISNGVYSTIMTLPTSHWMTHHEGTFGDYMTMEEGDNVYFFSDRKIYGIGELVNINNDCKFLNFPEADSPYTYEYSSLRDRMILNTFRENKKNRMLCTFKGSPYFFENGVDMDDILSSNPQKFKMLRAFWKLSFIKIDDEENQALIDVILKNNEENLKLKTSIFEEYQATHNYIDQTVDDSYRVCSENILFACRKNDGKIGHEMAVEVGVLDYIKNQKTSAFGKWDYLSHQVIASPFKPIDYMDKMDIFGYRYIPNFSTISKYLVIEIKKGVADIHVINQVMKYVDWVNQEYSFGDYNMIEAYIVAFNFPEEIIQFKKLNAKRNFVKGGRNSTSQEWSKLRLIKYHFDPDQKKMFFSEI